MDSELDTAEHECGLRTDVAGGAQGLTLQRNLSGCPQACIYGSQFHVATEAPELRSLVLGTILVFSVLKGISCLILVEAEETAFLDAILAGSRLIIHGWRERCGCGFFNLEEN